MSAGRECGACTACCEGWLNADINGVEVKPGKPCGNLCASGCGIYEQRPKDPCQDFRCAWLQEDSPLPDHLRPDQCGAIVMLDRNWHGWQTIRAMPVGENIPEPTLDWLKQYAQQSGRPLIFSAIRRTESSLERTPETGFGPPAFVEAVRLSITPADIYMGPGSKKAAD